MFRKRIAIGVGFANKIVAGFERSVHHTCGRKVADAGLRQTDEEESRLPPPILKAHVDGSHGRACVLSFVRLRTRCTLNRSLRNSVDSVDMSKP